MEVTKDRVLCKPDELKREHAVEGTDIKLALAAPADMERRQEAAIQQGYLISVGPMAYNDWEGDPPKVGDFVLWMKYSGTGVIDPDTGEKLVLMNDEDIVIVLKRGEV